MFDKAKLKLFMGMLKELAPELEFRIEKMRIKFKGDKEAKVWMAFLMRDKTKVEKAVTVVKEGLKAERCSDHD